MINKIKNICLLYMREQNIINDKKIYTCEIIKSNIKTRVLPRNIDIGKKKENFWKNVEMWKKLKKLQLNKNLNTKKKR